MKQIFQSCSSVLRAAFTVIRGAYSKKADAEAAIRNQRQLIRQR